MHIGGDRRVGRCVELDLGDMAVFQQSSQYIGPAFGSVTRTGHRIERGRGGRDAGDGRDFREGQLLEAFAVVNLRGGGDPVGALPQKNGVEVQRQHLILR